MSIGSQQCVGCAWAVRGTWVWLVDSVDGDDSMLDTPTGSGWGLSVSHQTSTFLNLNLKHGGLETFAIVLLATDPTH